MTKHISKQELKQTDTFLQEGRKAFFAFARHQGQVGVAIGTIAVIIAGILFFNHNSEKKELELQAQYYKIEKSYLKKKEEIEKAKQAKLDTKKSEKENEINIVETNENSESTIEKYKSEVEQFTQLIQANPKTMAASMSALLVTEIYSENKKYEEAKSVLDLVYSKSTGNNVVRALIGHTLGTLNANLGKCDEALKIWEPMIKNKNLEYLGDELQLKSAVCQVQLGQTQKAEEILTNLKSKQGSLQGRAAEKYLRLINLKKQGT